MAILNDISIGTSTKPIPSVYANNIVVGGRDEKTLGGVPIGTIIPYTGNGNLPSGYLECNGASVARATYPALFTVIGTAYGAVDDDHFNLPDLSGKFLEGADTAGTSKDAGLPNITGQYAITGYGRAARGAFSLTSNGT